MQVLTLHVNANERQASVFVFQKRSKSVPNAGTGDIRDIYEAVTFKYLGVDISIAARAALPVPKERLAASSGRCDGRSIWMVWKPG